MSKSIEDIAKDLKAAEERVQLIYAFNGTGKTRLSHEFKKLVASGSESSEVDDKIKLLYYSASTEDLFYWDQESAAPTLRIQANEFTGWLMGFLSEQGQDGNIAKCFQNYINAKITPHFNEDMSAITFSLERGGDDTIHNLKISKGEESNFVWSIIYTLLEEVKSILSDNEDDRPTEMFDELKHVYIDDPVSSLDENHLIEIAIDLVKLIKSSNPKLKFIVSTHNPLFYNVFTNTFKRGEQEGKKRILKKYILKKNPQGKIDVKEHTDSLFSYHLHLIQEIQTAIDKNSLKKYHFNFLRNILEKTAIFLGHENWKSILPEKFKDAIASYEERMINISSHSDYAGEEAIDLNDKAAKELDEILKAINSTYNFKKQP